VPYRRACGVGGGKKIMQKKERAKDKSVVLYVLDIVSSLVIWGTKPQNILETPSQNRPQLQFLDKGGRKIVKGLLLLAGGKITFLPYTARHEREKHQETATLLK